MTSHSLANIIFPNGFLTVSQAFSALKRQTFSIPNRLRSVYQDATFVTAVADAYGLPLVANERCGSWYVPPERRAASVYFKSTDGHAGEWGFSLRRLNIHMLAVVEDRHG